MLFKSKSVITVIGLGLFALVCVIAGALILNRPDITEFSTDGYILSASAEEGAENVMVSEQIWFGQGSSWKEGKEEVRFSDAQGDSVQVPTDSFIHYSDNSLSAVTDLSVMSLDDYAQGVIQYYVLKQGVPMKWDGSNYTIGEGADAVSFRSFLMKSSDEHYLLGSDSLNLIQNNGQAAHVDNGYLELEYLASDKSVALLNDGTNAWQILTEGAVIELQDGTTLNLNKGQLELPEKSDGQAQTGFYLDDMEINVSRQNIWQNQNGYPVYRFTVLNGEDGVAGMDGAAGEDGETGEDGEEGEQGTDGTNEQSGAAGSSGNSGEAGTVGASGANGGQMSGVNVSTSIPVVSLKSWSVNGKGLKFTVYTDEVSCNSIIAGTTRISLVDTNTGQEVYYWDGDSDRYGTGQQIDLSEDSADGFELHCSVLEAGHQYRLTVSAEYTVNDATGSQVLLSRNFTADDYGLSFEMTDKTSDTFTFAMEKSNQLITVDFVDVYVNGEYYGIMQENEYDGYTIDLKTLAQETEKDHANQTYQISFRPRIFVTSFNDNGESTTVEVGSDGSIRYDYTVTTLKNEPNLGGIRLTAYDSGYLLAEVLGTYDTTKNKYEDVSDPDETIEKIRFELYGDLNKLNSGKGAIAVQESTSGYLAYFNVSEKAEDPVHINGTYYVRAYYTYSDGTKEMTLPVLETNGRTEDGNDHQSKSFAWDIALPVNLVSTTLSFEGSDSLYNTAEEAVNQTNKGITYNALSGSICATMSDNNRYIVSSDHPMELHISANPDYYLAIQYGSYDPANKQLNKLDPSVYSGVQHLSNEKTVRMPVDLTGLRANTAYMFTLYGYEKTGDNSYNRVTMGSVAVTTRSYKEIALKMEAGDADGIGVNLRLGGSDEDRNYYNIDTNTYASDYMSGTSASYRGLYSITFELYREGTSTPLGTCSMVDKHTTELDKNSIYEEYFGTNAKKTLEKYKKDNKNYKGIIGVGKDDYPYFFVNSENQPLKQGELTDGIYYVKATVAYDYTKMRYDIMDNADGTGTYDYYTYRSDESEYVNKLDIMEITGKSSAMSDPIEAKALPYPEPSEVQYEDNSYIKVDLLTNDKLGAYNGDSAQNSLYSTSWDKDTVAGVQLSTKYLNDANTTTDSLYFYGFTWSDWSKIENDDTPTALEKDTNNERYAFRCQLELKANDEQIVPKVWLLFYDPEDLPKIEAASTDDNSGISQVDPGNGDKGYLYRQTTEVNREKVEIFYMDKKNFSRGQSYVFAYETLLPDYTYTDEGGTSHKGDFYYPKDYYTQIKGGFYTKQNTLASGTVSIKRQVPKVYTSLEKTSVAGDRGTDQWKVYVSDPDDAIHWESMLQTAKDNHVPDGSKASDKGGIYDLYGLPLTNYIAGTDGGENQYLTFTFGNRTDNSGQKILDTRTVYNAEDDTLTDDQLLHALKAEDLSDISNFLTDVSMDMYTAEISDRGGKIRVSNLPADGKSYQLKVDYLLLDDIGYNASTSYSCISLIEHNFIGKNDYLDEKDKLQLTKAAAGDDHNTMYLYLNPSENALTNTAGLQTELEDGTYTNDYYLGKEYLNKARTIAAVSLKAYNETDGKYIFERDSETGVIQRNKQKVLWLYPEAPTTGSKDYRYYLKFKLSDLDKTTEKDIQYKPGNKLKFEMTVYYLTGEGGIESSEYESPDYYAIKSVRSITDKNLYGTGKKIDTANYLYTSNTTSGYTETGAGRSLFKLKTATQTEGALPWSQQLTITSDSFDPACKELKLSKVDLISTEKDGIGKSVLEVMKIASYKAPDQDNITVGSAAPSLQNVKIAGGIVQINLQADVENWNLVEYPTGENLHLYYLIYGYTVGSDGVAKIGELQGAMVGEPGSLIDSGGKLNLTFPFTQQERSYWIEVYYKDKTAAESAGAKFDTKTDANLFKNMPHESGKLYITVAGGNDQANGEAFNIANVIKGTDTQPADPSFKLINGINQRLLVKTAKGLEMSDVALNLGTDSAYTDKKLNVTTKISSPILDAEKETMKIFYRLERCEENSDQSKDDNWKTIIAEESDTGVGNWEAGISEDEKYWSYYDSGTNGRDITLTPAKPQTGNNEMMIPYYAGGLIRPGYAYRIKAAIYQQSGDGYTLVSDKTLASQPDGYRVSNVVTWSSMSLKENPQAMVQTTNVIKGSGSIKLDYRVNDLNGTSLDGKYFVRLAKKENGTYKVVEGTERNNYYYRDTSGNWMNRVYTMGSTYQKVGFGLNNGYQLDPNTTYRLQFYALMDPEYDNTLNVSNAQELLGTNLANLPEIMTRSGYYPRQGHDGVQTIPNTYDTLYSKLYSGMKTYESVPDGLTLEKIAGTDNSLLIGYSDDITTLTAEETASAGTHQQTIVSDAHLITLKFNGAYNAGEISRIVYSLVRENSNGTTTQWDAVTVDKPDGITSMFDSTGSGSRNDGTEGKISLRLALGDAEDKDSMNVKNTGKYYISLKMQKYDQSSSSYVTVGTYSVKFNNTTEF